MMKKIILTTLALCSLTGIGFGAETVADLLIDQNKVITAVLGKKVTEKPVFIEAPAIPQSINFVGETSLKQSTLDQRASYDAARAAFDGADCKKIGVREMGDNGKQQTYSMEFVHYDGQYYARTTAITPIDQPEKPIAQPDPKETNTIKNFMDRGYTFEIDNATGKLLKDSDGLYRLNLVREEIKRIEQPSSDIYILTKENFDKALKLGTQPEKENHNPIRQFVIDHAEPICLTGAALTAADIALFAYLYKKYQSIKNDESLNDDERTAQLKKFRNYMIASGVAGALLLGGTVWAGIEWQNKNHVAPAAA